MPSSKHLRLLRIFFAPPVIRFFPPVVIREQLLFVLGEIGARLLRNEIMLVRQAESFSRGIHELCAGFAMRFLPFPATSGIPFPIKRVGDDELRFAVVALLRDVEASRNCLHVVALDFLHVEAVSLETLARCLRSASALAMASSVTALES